MTDPENGILAVLLLFEFEFEERNAYCCSHSVNYEPFALSLSKGFDKLNPNGR